MRLKAEEQPEDPGEDGGTKFIGDGVFLRPRQDDWGVNGHVSK